MTKKKKREIIVCKHNDLVRKSYCVLSALEQKTLAFLIANLEEPEDKDKAIMVVVSLQDVCRGLSITPNFTNCNLIVNALERIRDVTIHWVNDNENTYNIGGWLSGATVRRATGIAEIEFDRRLAPYLLELKANYTAYGLANLFRLESKYSVKLYEILKSYAKVGEYETDIDYLKELLGILDSDGNQPKKYQEYYEFRSRIIDKAVNEINRVTDLQISYKTILERRKAQAIKFKIKQTTPEETEA